MRSPFSDTEYSNKWIVYGCCCCGCSVRTGCLVLGYFDVIYGILSIIASIIIGVNNPDAQWGYVQIITLVVGILLLVGVYKLHSTLLWITVYILLFQIIFSFIIAIVCFAFLLWGQAVIILIGCLLNVYFLMVVRSYAYLVDAGRGEMNNPA